MGSSIQDMKNNGKRKFNRKREQPDPADWSRAHAGLLAELISCASKTGGAIRFGYSRDGGAYSIGVYGDGNPYTEYVSGNEDIDQFLIEMISAFGGDIDQYLKQPLTGV